MHWFSPACLSCSYAAISVSAAELILMGVASEASASGSEASEASIMVDRERDELRGSSAGSRGQQRRTPRDSSAGTQRLAPAYIWRSPLGARACHG